MQHSFFCKMSDFMEMSWKVICFILQQNKQPMGYDAQLEFGAKCPGEILTGNVRGICLTKGNVQSFVQGKYSGGWLFREILYGEMSGVLF